MASLNLNFTKNIFFIAKREKRHPKSFGVVHHTHKKKKKLKIKLIRRKKKAAGIYTAATTPGVVTAV
jgi:hypothetical protein